MNKAPITVGVTGGRRSPMHLGHEAQGIRAKTENDVYVIFLGSTENHQSYRHFFSAENREKIIKTRFPDAVIVKIPDIRISDDDDVNNAAWVAELDRRINEAIPGEKKITFYGGSYEDVSFFEDAGKNVKYLNRFDGIATPKISASEIRDFLFGQFFGEHNRDVRRARLLEKGFVSPDLVDIVLEVFEEECERFKKK